MRARTAALFALLAFAVPARAAGPSPVAEARFKVCLSSNIPADVRTQVVELQSTDAAGATRTLTGRIFASQEAFAVQSAADAPPSRQLRAVLQIYGPKDLAGAAWLVRDAGGGEQDGVWSYVPAVGSARRITGAAVDSSLFGTAFSFMDFKLLLNSVDDMATTLESEGTHDGRAVYVATFKPKDAARDIGLVRAWIDQQTCVPLKLDFHRGETLQRQALIRPDAVQGSAGAWYPVEVEMKDLAARTRTVLRATLVERKGPVPAGLFETGHFHEPYAP